MAITASLSEFISGLTFTDLPAGVVQRLRGNLLKVMAAAVAGATDNSVRVWVGFAEKMTGKEQPRATLIGWKNKVGLQWAALVNGYAARVGHQGHAQWSVALTVVPTVLALAEYQGNSGREVLAALAVGCETGLRMAKALGASHFERGWDMLSTCGSFAATAAAAHLMGLSAGQTGNALGVAASMASGLQAMEGTMAEAFHVGKAAYNGLWAASLAREGFTGPREALEGKRSFLRVAGGPDSRPEQVTEGLGETWYLAAASNEPLQSVGIAERSSTRSFTSLEPEEQLHRRFLLAVTPLLGDRAGRELLDLLWNIDVQRDVGAIARYASGPSHVPS